MSEWLTTGEMIDRLKVGEVAECIDANEFFSKANQVTKAESGGLVWVDEFLRSRVYLASAVINAKWRILPKYVSFEGAISAMKEGKKVTFHDGDKKTTIGEGGSMDWTRRFSWRKLINGKWTIEDDSND